MKLNILQNTLYDAIRTVMRASSRRSSLPVLANILLATENGRLKLAATNLELVIVAYAGAKVEEEGAITVPAKTLHDLVNALPSGPVTLTLDETTETLQIEAGKTKANVKGIDAEEFPLLTLPGPDEEPSLSLEVEAFNRIVQRVAFAAASDDARPTLTAVLFHLSVTEGAGPQLVLAATDGFRLSEDTLEMGPGQRTPIDRQLLVPANAVEEVVRVAKGDRAVELFLPRGLESRVTFRCGEVLVVSQLIEGNFPQYKSVIPQGSRVRVTAPTVRLRDAVKLAHVFARDAAHTVNLTIDQDGITVFGQASELGDNTGHVPADAEGVADGQPLELSVNAQYLMTALEALGTDEARLELNNRVEPLVLKPVDGNGAQGEGQFVHIIMPMQQGR